MEIETTVAGGLPCIARVTSYSEYRCNSRGHIDTWLPDDPDDLEFELLTTKGKPAEWIETRASYADWKRIEAELLEAINDI
jgi:hypothetical protein